ncbi:MAG: TonB-dependent receptor [Gemmatimonadetes bacterium]|nr:TonB-dependent receptor [Gemmatimonadota bacterium]
MTIITALLAALLAVSGQVRDASTRAPLPHVTVEGATGARTETDSSGHFIIDVAPGSPLRFTRPGFLAQVIPAASAVLVELVPSAQRLEGVTVTAVRAQGAAPIASTTIGASALDHAPFAVELPLLLQGTTSLTSYAEAGGYNGYSYVRLRGIDQTRINLTLDGVPLNDPEDEVFYFADFPDFANSLHSVQVQRGVGTSSIGTASYGGSINFETLPLASTPRGGELQAGGGAFGTQRASLEYASGLLSNGFAYAARVSTHHAPGYRRHSANDGNGVFLDAGWFGDRDVLKLTVVGGLSRNSLAYSAVPESELRTDPRANPLGPDEKDRFDEELASLSYTRLLGARSSLSLTAYGIRAVGNYDVAISPDLWNFNLDFGWGGAIAAWSWRSGNAQLDAGATVSRYHRDHYLFIRPDLDTRTYSNRGLKGDASGFLKAGYTVGSVTLFGDLQLRDSRFRYQPDAAAGIPPRSIAWQFLNPKAGLTWRATRSVELYASYGVNGREPTRSDMFAGFDNVDTSNVDFVGSLDRVKPETARDLEAGARLRGAHWTLAANGYAMRFRNEILPIGQLSYIGTPLRKNVAASARTGIELDGELSAGARLLLSANATLSRNRIREYEDDASGTTFHEVTPLLTPSAQFNHQARYAAGHGVMLALGGRYSSTSQLANTGDARFVLPSAYTLTAALSMVRGRYGLDVSADNLTNGAKYASGYTDGAQSYYYVQAPRNVMAVVRRTF